MRLDMTGHGAKFTRKMEEAISALLTHRNVEEAAKSIGIAPRTLARWQQLPAFDRAYREARRKAFGQSTARLQQAASAAVTTLLKIAVDATAPSAVRARSAYYILTLADRAAQTEDIESRLAALESEAEFPEESD
jgi:uncharacterized protein (DUF1501 family)